MAEDYYKTLGIAREASQAEIQKAYREMARKYHPDLNPKDKTAKKKFQQVQQAFDVLNSPEKREMYDRYGSSFETMGPGGPGGPSGPGSGAQGPFSYTWSPGAGTGAGAEDADFSQFFGERFGGQGDAGGGFADMFRHFSRAAGGRGRRQAAQRSKGADITHELQIPLHTAVAGGEEQITVVRADGKRETIAIHIPRGVDDGKKIRLRGQGEASSDGGPAGDILLTIRVQPHAHFQRQGNNLLVKVPITLGEAASGAKVDVPAASGTVSVTIPPGASSGMKLRVKGQGVQPIKGAPGDLLAELLIVLPKTLSDKDRETIAEIDQRYPQQPRTNLHW